MSLLPLIYTVFGIAFGWFLNEASQLLRLRREERRAIGRALKNLMHLRLTLYALKMATEQMANLTKLTPQQLLQFQQLMHDTILPDAEGLHTRYEETVEMVSGVKPLLGLWLSQQATLVLAVKRLRKIAALDEQASSNWFNEVKDSISAPSILDDIILELARLHGIKTLVNVRKHLKKPIIISPTLKDKTGELSGVTSNTATHAAPNNSFNASGD